MLLTTGVEVDRYRVEEIVTDAGHAEVYRVRHVWLGTPHAMKLLNLANNAVIREALLTEGRTMASLGHPNLVRVTDALVVHGLPALIMDWVDGPSLADWLGTRRGPVPVDAALRVFDGILAGLHHAHRAGVVHRDLKPENVMLARTPEGLVPRITDFGMAKVYGQPGLSMMYSSFGTPEYMAPEQIVSPASVDDRADLWGLGCILYELLTGELAFDEDNPAKTLQRVAKGIYRSPVELRPDLPAPLVDLIRSLLQVDRARRPASCREVRLRVREISGG